jgi:A/G-specific adenine glycosylase
MPPSTRRASSSLAELVTAHYRRARRDLPWRRTRDPYAIWVSEIMLQQTRVATVIPYWERWMARFPTVRALAEAPLDDVLAAWAGLGYYSRARNLHAGAAQIAAAGAMPSCARELVSVKGIGAYTAGAIASIAFGERAPLVDGNVARVLARVHAIDDAVKSATGAKKIWAAAAALMSSLPETDAPGDLNQGLMELGATVCAPRAPSCLACPLHHLCAAYATGRQDELPRLPPRKRSEDLPLLAHTALWIEDGGELLLARRRPDGLYGGLWELPPAGDALATETGDVVHTHEHVLSHRRLRISVVTARVRRASLGKWNDPGYDALSWHPLAKLADLGISSATAAIVRMRLAQKESSWSSFPKRSPSSEKATRRSSKASAASATTSRTRTSRIRSTARRAASTSSSTIKRR